MLREKGGALGVKPTGETHVISLQFNKVELIFWQTVRNLNSERADYTNPDMETILHGKVM